MYCKCGCGLKTSLIQYNDSNRGLVKGNYRNYVNGHNRTKPIKYIINEVSECWEWQLAIGIGGYGVMRITVNGTSKSVFAHRHFYEKYKGKIPSGLELDHLCRNRRCVNPDHLEPV